MRCEAVRDGFCCHLVGGHEGDHKGPDGAGRSGSWEGPQGTLSWVGPPTMTMPRHLFSLSGGGAIPNANGDVFCRKEPELPSEEILAKALAYTLDIEWQKFVTQRSEAWICSVSRSPQVEFDRVAEIAWKRDELGARTRWTRSVRVLLDNLKHLSKPTT